MTNDTLQTSNAKKYHLMDALRIGKSTRYTEMPWAPRANKTEPETKRDFYYPNYLRAVVRLLPLVLLRTPKFVFTRLVFTYLDFSDENNLHVAWVKEFSSSSYTTSESVEAENNQSKRQKRLL